MKAISVLLRIFFISITFLLTACGSGDGSDSTSTNAGNGGTNSKTELPSDISGLVVLEAWDMYGYSGMPQGIFSFELESGQLKTHKRLTTGGQGVRPYAQSRDVITYAQPCHDQINHRTRTFDEKGISSEVIIPCSTNYFSSFAWYTVAKISPNKKYIAVEIETNDRVRPHVTKRIVKVFDMTTKEELSNFENYNSPVWLPDNRLIMATSKLNNDSGIYLTDKRLAQLTRIDQGVINQNASFLDISPTGNKLIFTMSGIIWMMDINQNHRLSNIKEIVNDGFILESAKWSPDGKYIAYLTFSGNTSFRKITFWHIASKTPFILKTQRIFPTNGIDFMTPARLSWVR